METIMEMIVIHPKLVISKANNKQFVGYLVDAIEFLINEGVDPHEITKGIKLAKVEPYQLFFNGKGCLISFKECRQAS